MPHVHLDIESRTDLTALQLEQAAGHILAEAETLLEVEAAKLNSVGLTKVGDQLEAVAAAINRAQVAIRRASTMHLDEGIAHAQKMTGTILKGILGGAIVAPPVTSKPRTAEEQEALVEDKNGELTALPHPAYRRPKPAPAPAPAPTPTTHTVWCQLWEESERGWGVRPDGYSLHLTKQAATAYVADYWEREKAKNLTEAPDEYSRECGEPFAIEVGPKTVAELKKDGHIRTWTPAHPPKDLP